jgi:hypothetical protein
MTHPQSGQVRSESDRPAVHVVLALATSLAILAGGHFLAFLGQSVDPRVPYWWSWLITCPLASALFARAGRIPWWLAASLVCAVPSAYFVALGVTDGLWDASNRAVTGSAAAFLLSLLAAYVARPRVAR